MWSLGTRQWKIAGQRGSLPGKVTKDSERTLGVSGEGAMGYLGEEPQVSVSGRSHRYLGEGARNTTWEGPPVEMCLTL